MTETPKAPRKRAAPKPRLLDTPEAKAAIRENAAAGRVQKAARVTALQRARLNATRALSRPYGVRGPLARWLLSFPSHLALAVSTPQANDGRKTHNGRNHSLHFGRIRFERFA